MVLQLSGWGLATFWTAGLFRRRGPIRCEAGAGWLGMARSNSETSSDLAQTPGQERVTESQFLPLPPWVNCLPLTAQVAILSLDGPNGLCPGVFVALISGEFAYVSVCMAERGGEKRPRLILLSAACRQLRMLRAWQAAKGPEQGKENN